MVVAVLPPEMRECRCQILAAFPLASRLTYSHIPLTTFQLSHSYSYTGFNQTQEQSHTLDSSSVLNQLPSDPLFPLTLWNTIAKKSVHINWRITFLQFSNYYLGSAYFLSIAYPRMWGYRTCPIHRKGDRISAPETMRV